MLTGVYLWFVCVLSTAAIGLSWVPQLVGAAFGLCWIVVGLLLKGWGIRFPRPIVWYTLFFIWSSTGILVTISVDYYTTHWMTSAKVLAVTWIASQCVRSRQDLMACLFLVGAAGAVVLFTGLDTILHAIRASGSDASSEARASGTLINNANGLGVFGVTVVISAVASLFVYRSWILRCVSIGAAACGLYLVAASGSRTAMVGFVVALIALYYYQFRKANVSSLGRRVTIIVLSVVLTAGGIYYFSNLPFLFRLIDVFSSKEAMQKEPRYVYFVRALEATGSHPVLGLGLGGFAANRLGRNAEGKGHYSHSTLSETLSCTGVPGFLFYYGGQLSLFLLLRRVRRLTLPPRDRTMVNIVFVFFWVLIVFSVVAVMYQDRLIWPLYGAMAGYLYSMKSKYEEPAPAPGAVAWNAPAFV